MYAHPARSAAPSAACITGSVVRRLRMSAIRLRWRGSRCCTTTTAAGKSTGSAASTWVSAFSPPAEAASATTSKPAGIAAPGSVRSADQPAEAADAALLERNRAHAEVRSEGSAPARLQPGRPGERLGSAEQKSHGAGEELDAVGVDDVIGERAAADLVARRVEELERGLVGLADAAAGVGDQVGIRRELEELRIALVLAHQQRRLSLQLFPHHVELLERHLEVALRVR